MRRRLSTADELVTVLQNASDPRETERIRTRVATNESVIGVRMSTLFATAKLATDIPAAELERLFIHPAYEPRLAAFCILDFRTVGASPPRNVRTSPQSISTTTTPSRHGTWLIEQHPG